MSSPTEKQISFVESICEILGIKDFPSCSREYSKFHFSHFISTHIQQYYSIINSNKMDEEDLYFICEEY